MFLSIIIPVYNGEKCITYCLDSIWSQGLDVNEYEVICVNDCSKDNTVGVVTTLQKKHPNLRLLSNQENLRAGGSRNYGVREAHGEYILFIDADDYFHPGALKKIFDYQQKYRLDILVCDFARHTLQAPNDLLVHNFHSHEVMTGRQFLVINSLPYAPWKYVFRKTLMVDNKVYFEEKVSCEDVDWSHKIALYAQTMQYQPILLTHYILTDNSQTSVEYKSKATVLHRLFCGYRVIRLLSVCKTEEEKDKIYRVARATTYNGIIFFNALCISPLEKRDMIKKYIPKDINWGSFINAVRDNAFIYSCLSTMISPFFRLAIKIKRKIAGR